MERREFLRQAAVGAAGLMLTEPEKEVVDPRLTQKATCPFKATELSRPFGFAWLRSGTPGEYKYELVQDLRSQLLEEELCNRHRHQALLALEKEIERYRHYLTLSLDEALERARTAPPGEKEVLER